MTTRRPRAGVFARAAAASTTAADAADLNDYERERAARIAQNAARLKELAVGDAVAALAPPPRAPAARRGVKRTRVDPAAPRRGSARLAGQASDGAHVVDELKGGHIVALGGVAASDVDTGPKERHPPGDVPFVSDNGGDDASFVTNLKAATGAGRSGRKGAPPLTALARATLAPSDVTKVTRDGAVHLAFHPTAHKLVLAVASKKGQVCLWDAGSEPRDEEDASHDGGVLAFQPHYQYVSGLSWAADTGGLYTCSYDGSIRLLDVERPDAAFAPILLSDTAEWSAFDVASDARLAIVGDKDGDGALLDPRSRTVVASFALADRKINTLALAPASAPPRLAAAYADGGVRVYDLRALRGVAVPKKEGGSLRAAPVVAAGAHGATCQSAYWSPDGASLLTTSRDDTLAIWEDGPGASLARVAVCPHDNQTGRWVIPFRAVWAPSGDGVLCGGMRRTVDVFGATGGKPRAALADETMTAIASRLAPHLTAGALAAATGSGRVNVWRY